MRFEWDEEKRRENLRKHRLDFRDVPEVFIGETATDIDERYDYGETRYYTLGMLHGVVVAISHTEKDDLVRIISFRTAERHEQEIYFKTVRD
jgi:uncharacterized protein